MDSPIQDRNQASRTGLSSRGVLWNAKKDSISLPSITPSFNRPLESPSMPDAIMRVPDTWQIWILREYFISKALRRTTRE
jgi:hypothetical protein